MTVTDRRTVRLTAAASGRKGTIVTVLDSRGQEVTGTLWSGPDGVKLDTTNGWVHFGGSTTLLEFVLDRDSEGREIDADGKLVSAEDIAEEAAAKAAHVAERIHRNVTDACEAVVAARTKIAKLVESGTPGVDLARAVNELAEAEGVRDLWHRVQLACTYHRNEGIEFTKAAALEVALSAVNAGADDEWSGRGNDVRRARFDGTRQAARNIEWLF